MDTVLDIFTDVLPILLVIGAALYLFHETLRFIEKRDKRFVPPSPAAPESEPSPPVQSEYFAKLRLQAAERFALYLERINPGRLVMRLHRSGMTAVMLQNEMLRTIREEFDHNLSQQIYISEGSWELIKNAQMEMIKFINATAQGLKKDASALEFGDQLLKAAAMIDKLPGDVALSYLRNESRRIMHSPVRKSA